MIAHINDPGAPNKDIQSVWMYSQKFSFYCEKNVLTELDSRDYPKAIIFRRLPTNFNEHDLKKNLIISVFEFEFCFNFSHELYFLNVNFF